MNDNKWLAPIYWNGSMLYGAAARSVRLSIVGGISMVIEYHHQDRTLEMWALIDTISSNDSSFTSTGQKISSARR